MHTASWLKTIVDAAGGFDPRIENKVVVLQSTITNKQLVTPPHPRQFRGRRMQEHLGGYPKILFDGLVDMDDREAVVSPGLISANNSKCFLCSVKPGNTAAHVGGPEECEISEECDAEAPAEAFAQAQSKASFDLTPPVAFPAMGNAEEAPLPDTWMLWNEVTVWCRPMTADAAGAACLTPEYVKEIVKGFVRFNATTNDYQISVAPVGVHGSAANFTDAAVTELSSVLEPSMGPDQACSIGTKYDVRVMATEPAVEQHLLDVFEEMNADPSDLQQTLIDNWDLEGVAAVEPCAAAVVEKGETRIPSIKKMPAFKPSEKLVMGPNVVVADDKSIVPLTKLVPGETYKVYVQNFPYGSEVSVKLLSGFSLDGPTVATIKSFDDDGTHEVDWTVPADMDVSGACLIG